ncbi:MAG TPA: acetate--CoA ligase family protein [Ramlibacter sp.]|nr:acetate--CoA ligase family protein [Ramlibacter sp.]
MNSTLDSVFRARSVALVGLSSDSRKMTGAPLGILRQTGFAGDIWPVNPRHAEIGGLRSYARIEDLPGTPDVAMIMLPAADCAAAVRACAARGIRGCVIPSSGFEETETGHAHAQALRAAARDTGMAVVGPNCEGLWSVRSRVLLTFGSAARRDVLHHAPIAILSQSGAIGGAVARHLQEAGVGCAYMVSVGNEAVLTLSDYLEWMILQDDVRVVALFIEGLRDGARLLQLVRRAAAGGIRVVALKSGNSAAGLQAAASHTGKMASDFEIYRQLLQRAGAVLVDSLADLVAACEVLSLAPLPPRRGADGGVSVFSIPGGTRAMTVDHLDAQGVPLARFTRATVAALAAALPDFGGVENPTDLTGQVLSHPGLFDECLQHIARDPGTEALIVQVANRGPADVLQRIDLLGAVARGSAVPLVATFLGDTLPPAPRAQLRAAGVLCARDPAEAARFLGWLYRVRAGAARPLPSASTPRRLALAADWQTTAHWLQQAGLTPPAWQLLRAGETARDACGKLRYPVAVKALPEQAEHKTELGLLTLGVATPTEVDREAARIRSALGQPQADILVQEMASPGVEVVLAALRNPDFGPVLAIGLGGIATELFSDLAWLALPATADEVREAIAGLRVATLLAGFRGRPRADSEALVQAAVRFGQAFVDTVPLPAELEINPLIVQAEGHGVVAVDALVKLQDANETHHD